MIETKEVLKYLRTASGVEDAALFALIEQCKQTAYATVEPRTIYEIFPCTVGETYTEIAGIRFESARLAEKFARLQTGSRVCRNPRHGGGQDIAQCRRHEHGGGDGLPSGVCRDGGGSVR